MVTSSLWEKRSFTGSGFPLKNSPCARKYRSISSSTSSTAATTIRFIVAPLLAALLSHRALYRTLARKRETGHHASVLAWVAGRTTGSASSLIGCHVLQWDGLLSLYP